jgi:hypothetical protein
MQQQRTRLLWQAVGCLCVLSLHHSAAQALSRGDVFVGQVAYTNGLWGGFD